MSVEEILKTHPRPRSAELAVLVRCIDECGNCEGDLHDLRGRV